MKAVIYGMAGETLTAEEKQFFAAENPFGFILFARNCANPSQIRALTAELRAVVGRDNLFILIDQEGGRVARLRPPHWRAAPAAGCFAELAKTNPAQAEHLTYANARLLADELRDLGITVNCAPMADVRFEGYHKIVGDRAFGDTPEKIVPLARAMARGLTDGGVFPVLKHIPGHGRAKVDSHESLPIVTESLEILAKTDFAPFQQLAYIPFGMTAHIVYTALDAENPATLSPVVIEYIRREIGFSGLLMSDDLSMKALKGGLGELAQQTLAAGCDLVLHCNGNMGEMKTIAPHVTTLPPERAEFAAQLWNNLPRAERFDDASARAAIDRLMKKEVA